MAGETQRCPCCKGTVSVLDRTCPHCGCDC